MEVCGAQTSMVWNAASIKIQVKTTKEDKRTLEAIAKKYRVSLSTHMRQIALKDVIENEPKFQ